MTTDTLTVSQVAARIQGALDAATPDELWIEGELHGLKRSPTGHVFFDLVEPGPLGGPPVATLSVVLFEQHRRGVNALLRRAGSVRMVDGMQVRIRGSLDFYPPQGRLQVRMTGIDTDYTLGRLAAERDRVLRALAADGLLEANRARPSPLVPLRIGLVTAAGSAAYADFVRELEHSGHGFSVHHVDARVQGRDAERSVVAALAVLSTRAVDVIAVVRGGGARTELAVFDGDAIARAIATCPVPVHTGIGHDIDRSVADEVAHTAHKTPTACAAALVTAVDRYLTGLAQRAGHLAAATERALEAESQRLRQGAGVAASVVRRALDHHGWRLDDAATRATRDAQRALDDRTVDLARRHDVLGRSARRAVERAEHGLGERGARVRALDPARALARGWTITRTEDGRPVRARELRPGSVIVTTFADGTARSTVDRDPELEHDHEH